MTARPGASTTAHQPAARKRSWLGLFVPALLAFAILIALGTWQIERKAWKEALIASLTERLAAPPVALPPAKDWAKLDRVSGAEGSAGVCADFFRECCEGYTLQARQYTSLSHDTLPPLFFSLSWLGLAQGKKPF